jgi:hypothetical protein
MRRLLPALIVALIVVAVPVASARKAGEYKAPNVVLVAPRGQLAPGETVQLASDDLRFERKGALIKCPASVLTGSVVSNTPSDATVSLTGASFGGGVNEACNFLIPPGQIGFPVLATGLPWTMKLLKKGLTVSIESPSGAFIERPGTPGEPPCVYSARKLLLRSPGSVGEASVFEMSSYDARLKVTSGCATRPRPAALSADWTLSSEGEPAHIQVVMQ